MIRINKNLEQVFQPYKAFLAYHSMAEQQETYMEAYDIDENGSPINAHPLSIGECVDLANALASSEDLGSNFLQSKSLIPENVLFINSGVEGFAIWQSKAQKINMLFSEDLNIPNGMASIPPLIFKASKTGLHVFALRSGGKLNETTDLYHAPFFNVYSSGLVCMGTVKIEIPTDCCLEEFMELWERYFFNSYFSHMMGNHLPVKGNLVGLWESLVNSPMKFPEKVLTKTGHQLKSLLQ